MAKSTKTAAQWRRENVRQRDVARLAGVNPSTVSRALDPNKMSLLGPETRERVQAIAAELGYVPHAPAQNLRRGHTMSIGIVVAELGNPFVSVILDAIANVLDDSGFASLVAQTRDQPGRLEPILSDLRKWNVDAVITTAARRADAGILRRFADTGIPVVLAVRAVDDPSLPAVTHDDYRGGRLAAEYLADLGHKRVVQLCGPGDISSFAQRRIGFIDGAQSRGLEVIEVGEDALGLTVGEGTRLMELLLSREQDAPPTAVFAHNDSIAVGAIDVLRSRGLKCPDDVSVLGYNDAPFSDHLFPPLSTIRFPGDEIGRYAAEMVMASLRGDRERQQPSVSFPPELIVRGSTQAPRGSRRRGRGQPTS